MYEDIREQFDKVICYSQGFSEINSKELFETWEKRKGWFIEKFGGLIYTCPDKVHLELDNKTRGKYLGEFVGSLENFYHQFELAEFIQWNGVDSFYENRVSAPYTYNGVVIPKGMKLLKAFKFFESDKSKLEDLQNAASRVIQSNKVEGTLCFSVHPLDFLSVSENGHKWRSCHALDGEYRAGNLSYMQDSSTVVCYLKSDENIIPPNFPYDVEWNDKKWRVLLFISDNHQMLFAGRQYPFTSKLGIDKIKEECPFDIEWGEWYQDKIKTYSTDRVHDLYSPYIPVGDTLKPMKKLIRDDCGCRPLHFNDLLRSSCYDPWYAYSKSSSGISRETKFLIGSDVKCLCCGSKWLEDSEFMACEDCAEYDEDSFYCDCCGQRGHIDDAFYSDRGDGPYCEDCFCNYYSCCEECNEWYENEELTEYGYRWLCPTCYSVAKERDEGEI